jgi:ferrous iron transport protein B
MNDNKNIAIIGLPNCGKTCLFNSLTNANKFVANWSGATTKSNSGIMASKHDNFFIIDFPGIHILPTHYKHKPECEFTAFLFENAIDIIVNVVDLTKISSSMYLTLQLLELRTPMILLGSKVDLVSSEEKENFYKIAKYLEMPCFTESFNNIDKKPNLKQFIIDKLSIKTTKNKLFNFIDSYNLENFLETILIEISEEIKSDQFSNIDKKWLALRIIEDDQYIISKILSKRIKEKIAELNTQIDEVDIYIADKRIEFINTKLKISKLTPLTSKLSQGLDMIFLNKYTSIPFFLGVMYIIFFINCKIGLVMQGFCYDLFFLLSSKFFLTLLKFILPFESVYIFVSSMCAAIATSMSFFPLIFLVNFLNYIIYESGYISRVTFAMDRVLRKIHISGMSLIPLLLGFGCNASAISAINIIEDKKEKIITALMIPLMSCNARLVIYVIFANAFFPESSYQFVFLIYLVGIVLAILVAFTLSNLIPNQLSTSSSLQDLSNYQMPNFTIGAQIAWKKSVGFIKRTFRYILPIGFIVNALLMSHYDLSQNLLTRFLLVIFHPLGLTSENWVEMIALCAGFFAKELVITTLNTIYHSQQVIDASQFVWPSLSSLISDFFVTFNVFLSQLKLLFVHSTLSLNLDVSLKHTLLMKFKNINAATSYVLCNLLFFPCISTIAAISKELNTKWALTSFSISLFLGYSIPLFWYQLNSGHLYAIILLIIISFFALKAISKMILGNEDYA